MTDEELESLPRGDEPPCWPEEPHMNTDIVPVEAQPQSLVSLGTLQASTPAALISGATQIADQLAEIIRRKRLANTIQGREYVRVEGWTTLSALLGVIAREESVEELEDGGYRATVSLVRMSDGAVISRASSECGMDEPTWANRPKYARRSMAVTRATGKAARLAFSWIMSLAGFEPTPAEEMPVDEPERTGLRRSETEARPVPRGDRFATEKQVKMIVARLKKAGIPLSVFCDQFGIEQVAELPFARVTEAIDWIAHYKPPQEYDGDVPYDYSDYPEARTS